jgi:thioesterase domain-containing protein/acyl carrier protein
MTSLELTTPRSASPELLQQDATQSPAIAESSNLNQAQAAQQDLWEAIKTIIGFQNQAPPILPASDPSNLALSFPQERLWILDQLNSGSAAYNIPFAFRIAGDLDLTALEQSLHALLERHTVLRTSFTTQPEKVIQVIAPKPEIPLQVVDLQHLERAEREAAALHLAQEEAQRPFNLSQGPVFRVSLLQLDDQDYLLLMTVHHIVFDGWSEGVLWRDLKTLYDAFQAKKPSPLEELPIQYKDFAGWQRQWLQGDFLEALRSYWKQQLHGLPSELHLPLDHPRSDSPTYQSECQTQVISVELTQSLKQLSRQQGATLFVILLAAFMVLLQRYTEQDDLFICSPVANRNRKEFKDLVGYFVNLLVLRGDLSGNPSVIELLGRVRQSVTGSFAHQDFPTQQLPDCLERQLALSQVMFVFQNTPQQTLELSGLKVETVAMDNGTADFNLSLSMIEESGHLKGVWKYDTDLFDRSTIQQMQTHFQVILAQMVYHPTHPIGSLLLLDETEQRWLQDKRQNYQPVIRQRPLNTSDDRTHVSPRDVLELRMTNLWEKTLGIQGISVKDSFFDLGGESLAAMRLFADIKKEFGITLPVNTLVAAPTVEQLTDLLRQTDRKTDGDRSLVPLQVRGSKPPLFLVPPGAFTVLHFTRLLRYMEPDQPIYGLEHEGLDGKGIPYIRVEDMAAHHIQEIRSLQPEGPYFLAGRCFGGTVVFEMAQQLQAQGQEVGLLAILDTQTPPDLERSDTHSDPQQSPSQLKQKPKGQYWQRLVTHLQQGRLLPTDRVQRWVKGLLWTILVKAAKRKPVFVQLQTMLFPRLPQEIIIDLTFAAHKKARRDYTPKVYPGKITLFRTVEYPAASESKWAKIAGGGLDCRMIPGDHKTMFREPNIQVVAEKLIAALHEAQTINLR